MSVPYETACEGKQSPETPEEHLARLLGRALNSFELPDEVLCRLTAALAYDGSLHSAHHSGDLHRLTYRHTWLLADGSAVTLWELVHNTARPTPFPGAMAAPMPEGPARARQDQHELYADETELRTAMERLPLPADEPQDFDLPVTVQIPPMPLPRHVYVPDNSADHARRLLRRAENADRPGLDMLRLLSSAFAHQITQAFGRPTPAGEARLGYSLYEHAFLLADGREVSLWEVEHTATPNGRHMCEVYTSEAEARGAMARRASRTP
ncbi:DUF6227 family protein [Streptomyces sp. TS71-3]|uniref:DUF6227 family protein n=1 Tax=Streptomyces sp. TS71-3 TaxID=2733862 RepID=UPI001AFE40FD|nr:DUF6227 family protein [Streptomyces sp. TS71-3]GHJ39722.1 hypothetical protein Sm713_53310 [Streptomyces sp. TS71-3]